MASRDYCVVQKALELHLPVEVFREVSRSVPEVACGDCPRFLDEAFGILAYGLSFRGAQDLVAGLNAVGVKTEVVQNSRIPHLEAPRFFQRFDWNPDTIIFTDVGGTSFERRREDILFAAGGSVMERGVSRVVRQTFDIRHYSGKSVDRTGPGEELGRRLQRERSFHLDFFFTQKPYRLKVVLGATGVLGFRGEFIRLQQLGRLATVLNAVRGLVPPGYCNRALEHHEFIHAYPNLRAYEEEIRWHFFKLSQ